MRVLASTVAAFKRMVRRQALRRKMGKLNVGTYEPRSYWDQRAEFHELDPYLAVCVLHQSHHCNQQMHETHRQCLLPQAKRLLPGPGAHVLEVGCGVGRWTKDMEALGASYTGLDISYKMLVVAQRLNSQGRFVQSSGTTLPFVSGSFDMTLTVTVLHHIPYHDQEMAVRELVRVTRPGGHIVALEDIVQPTHPHHMFAHRPEQWIELFGRADSRLLGTVPVCYPWADEERALVFVFARPS